MKIFQKSRAILLGAAVADAAARPLHWIYDTDEIQELIGAKADPEFWPKSEFKFSLLLSQEVLFQKVYDLFQVVLNFKCQKVSRNFTTINKLKSLKVTE